MMAIDKVLQFIFYLFAMFWEILWALILGFGISALIQAIVSKKEMAKLLPDNSPKTLTIAAGLGAASSSCSYAATAIARSMFRKGANFTATIAFEFASTNLVLELGIIMAVLLGWQFTLAEFVGGPLMIITLALLFRIFLKKQMVDEAFVQANKRLPGSMEGHAAMDMSLSEGSIFQRMFSSKGYTATTHYFFMDWYSLWKDILLGLGIASVLAVCVPDNFWQSFFFSNNDLLAKLWGPLIGPLVSMLSFVCSIGNVPLAAILWAGGISFGGVISFIFADLLIIPILNIYRKYYGSRMMVFLFFTSYAAMALAGFLVEMIFGYFNLIPARRNFEAMHMMITFNYTTVLNIIFILLSLVMLFRFLKTGGPAMLKEMDNPLPEEGEHCHHCH
ncbi:MAG: permease [Candidatus Saganbacteria bacterium]|nr:permease [Candidatus Saganbacteria bacterium]